MFTKTLELMEKQRASGIYSGYSTSFILGKQVYRTTEGFASTLPKIEPLTQSYLFDVASLTKVILTTTVLFKLMDRKQIQLEDKIKRYLPDYVDTEVTIKQAMTHTSGINSWIANRDQLLPEELKKAYLNQKSGLLRGKKVVYTDTGFILLGLMLESIYQQSLEQIFLDEVLIPLNMNDSYLYQAPKNSLVVPTEQLETQEVLRGTVHDKKARVLMPSAGHAGLFTTINDLEKFVQMYLVNDGSYLSKEIIQQAQINQTVNLEESRGLGWKLVSNATDLCLFHTGYTGTFLMMDIQREFAWIFLSNRIHPRDHREEYIQARNELLSCFHDEYAEMIY